jgi:hypothetical protein
MRQAELSAAESVKLGLSFPQKQGHLVVQLGKRVAEQPENVCGPVLGLMMPAIGDSCGSLWFLIPNNRFRDAFVTGRTIFLTILNACFICSQGSGLAEKALRHAKQKAYRDLNRELRINERKIVLAYSGNVSVDADLDAAIREFTGAKGQELPQWTSESVREQLEKIDAKYGGNLAAMLGLAMMSVYRHGSEIAHGTLFGILWSIGATQKMPKSETELSEIQQGHWQSALNGLLFSLNAALWCLFQIVSREFPTLRELADESDVLFRELRTALVPEKS